MNKHLLNLITNKLLLTGLPSKVDAVCIAERGIHTPLYAAKKGVTTRFYVIMLIAVLMTFGLFSAFTSTGVGVYPYTGTITNVQAAIKDLIFSPTAKRAIKKKSKTINVSDSINVSSVSEVDTSNIVNNKWAGALMGSGAINGIYTANTIGPNTLDGLGLTAATPSAGAYALHKLSSTYAGSAIQVRRRSDNAILDIGFSSGNLDTVALKTFAGSGNAYVSIWYDQSGYVNNAVQATAAAQPAIVTAGVVNRINGRPTIVTDGVDDKLEATASTVTNNFSEFLVLKATQTHEIDGEANGGTFGTSGQKYVLGAKHGSTNAGSGLSVGTNGISNYEHGDNYMSPTAVYSGAVTGTNIIGLVYTNKTPKNY